MDRLALIGIFFFSGLLALNGSLTLTTLAARKGYSPRWGALVGALAGLLGGLTPALAVLRLADHGGLAVLTALIGGAGMTVFVGRLAPDRDPQRDDLPTGETLRRNIIARHVRGRIAQTLFGLSIAVALIALATLLWTIINKTVGLTAVQYAIEPGALTLVSFDPGAEGPEAIAPETMPALLTEHVHPVRLRELVLEHVAKAKPKKWAELLAQPLGEALPAGSYPASLADTPVGELTAAQAVEILTGALDTPTLQTLVYAEAGRPLSALSEAEIAARLSAALGAQAAQRLLLQRVVLTEADEIPAAPVAEVLNGFKYPEALAEVPFDQLDTDAAIALLIANLERADLEDAVLDVLDTPGLDDLPSAQLSAIATANVRKALLRVAILRDVAGAAEDTWPDVSGQSLSKVLAGHKYPPALAETPVSGLDEAQAVGVLLLNLGHDGLHDLLMREVVQAQVVKGWTLWESLTQRSAIEDAQQREFPRAELQWRSWLNAEFLTSPLDPRRADSTGVRPALYGSLLIIFITIVVAFPVGVGAAIYLEEYAGHNRLNQIIETNINNLAGVPSIIYGMLGLVIFVRALEQLTSGQAFGANTANGRTVLSAGFTLALLILPLIIINAQEAIRAVPNSLRQASYGLGATQWQTIWHHVLPYAMPGILTGTILAISRAIGETAPLILVGGATYLTRDPEGPFSIFTALPLLIYRWTTLPQEEFRNAAAAAIVVLLVLLLSLNSLAIILRNRLSRRLS